MPLVHMRDMLDHAYANGYAVGAFDVVSLDFLQAVVSAAERCDAPIILSLAESHFDYYDFELMMAAVERAARRTRVPTAIHLDHGASLHSVVEGIRLGCNGVMVDASQEGFENNVAVTRRVVETAHACGIPVEGELGYVPGVEGEDAERHPGEVRYTTAEEARAFRDRTGVDFLAVSVGTVHGRLKGSPELDFGRLASINAAVGIPLVIHGGTGLSDEQFRRLIANGVTKINYYTALADAAGSRVRDNAAADGQGGYTALVKGVQSVIAAEAERCIRLWGGAGRTDAVLASARPWLAVDHVIVYNVSEEAEAGVDAMMAEGRRVLGAIPGVREVIAGNAVAEDAPYRHCWLVRFAHSAVIASYREHPDHQAFADEHFRPVAQDRISIDFRAIEDRGPARRGAGPGHRAAS
ncbi:MAG: ketose-bisphosphate aldolase [Chromatiales bacterium]|jgi:fructose-bisphosphate aldolase class II